MTSKTILLIEDNPSDIELTRRALEKSRIANELVVVQDGQEALDYLFGSGACPGREAAALPGLALLDLSCPRSWAWKCCGPFAAIRAPAACPW